MREAIFKSSCPVLLLQSAPEVEEQEEEEVERPVSSPQKDEGPETSAEPEQQEEPPPTEVKEAKRSVLHLLLLLWPHGGSRVERNPHSPSTAF